MNASKTRFALTMICLVPILGRRAGNSSVCYPMYSKISPVPNERVFMSPVVPIRNSATTAGRWALPALAMLVLQISLYLWMAPRGFEFTDESYYFHNFLYWREFTGTVTFFGAYFEWPFRAMAGSVAGIRIFSLLLVLASSAIVMQQVLRFSNRESATVGHGGEGIPRATWWHLIAPMASAMLYFGYLTTLRAPSYNLLSLCTMALSTACLLRTLEQQAAGNSSRIAPLLYGVALGACFLSKATTALILVLLHFAFFAAVNRAWQWKRLAELFALISAGFCANLVVLTLAYPAWPSSMIEGIEVLRARGGYGFADMLKGLAWEVQRALVRIGPWIALLAVLFVVARSKLVTAQRQTISLLALGMVGASVATIALDNRSSLWLFAMAATTLGLWGLERRVPSSGRGARGVRSDFALMALLFVLPLAFSFGTNMPVLGHSAIASMFVFCAVYLRLYRLAAQGSLGGATLAGCVLLLCIPALVAQWLALTNVQYTYRQHSALGAQASPVTLGNSDAMLRVDVQTGKALNDIAAMFRQAGFKPGQDVLDLSGDGPGVIFAVGARPLGTPWMLGGYAGSTAAAGRVIEKLDPATLRNAWLLTSIDNPRRIKGWELIVAARVGPDSHSIAGTVDIATSYTFNDNERKTINLQLWKPVGPAPANRQP